MFFLITIRSDPIAIYLPMGIFKIVSRVMDDDLPHHHWHHYSPVQPSPVNNSSSWEFGLHSEYHSTLHEEYKSAESLWWR